MKEPKVGQRVRAYGGVEWPSKSDKFRFIYGKAGVITETFDESATIQLDEGCTISAHFRQCVPIRKRPRRRVWVSKQRVSAQDGSEAIIFFDEPSVPSEWVEFVEVRGRKGEI